MRRSAAERALQAADALDLYVRNRPPASFDAAGSNPAELPARTGERTLTSCRWTRARSRQAPPWSPARWERR